jgi:hypothetical protein
MLGVEQDPVEARVGDDLDADVAAHAAPKTDLQATLLDTLLEDVGYIHVSPLIVFA